MRSAKDDLIDDLREENARLRGLLREVEYHWSEPQHAHICPLCAGVYDEGGHLPSCPIAAALREGDDPDN